MVVLLEAEVCARCPSSALGHDPKWASAYFFEGDPGIRGGTHFGFGMILFGFVPGATPVRDS